MILFGKLQNYVACKVNIDQAKAEELMNYVEKIHNIFWQTKGRSDSFVKAS